MRSARCSECDINYPYDHEDCKVCDKQLWECEGETWDSDWRDKVKLLQSRWEIGKPLPNVDATIFEVKGHLFIANAMLRSFGYLDLQTDDVVMIQNRYFELEGRVRGKNDDGWWLKEVRIEEESKEWFKGIPTLSEFDYQNLQDKRLR